MQMPGLGVKNFNGNQAVLTKWRPSRKAACGTGLGMVRQLVQLQLYKLHFSWFHHPFASELNDAEYPPPPAYHEHMV